MAQLQSLQAASAAFMLSFLVAPVHTAWAAASGLRSGHRAEATSYTGNGPVSFTFLSRSGQQAHAKHGAVFKHSFGLAPAFQEPQPARAVGVSFRQMQALRSGLNRAFKKLPSRASSPMAFGYGLGEGAVGLDAKDGPPLEVISLRDLCRTEYVGVLGVGTSAGAPEANLRVVFDTGSSDLWVASDLCSSGACTRNDRRKYNHRHSETFRRPDKEVELTTAYGSGELRGELGVDDVRLGSLVVRKQQMGLISKEAGFVFFQLPFDGIAGLGFASIADTTTTPLLDNLMEQGALPRHEFAFYLHRDPDRGGAVLWGGTDSRLYNGTLAWFPVVEESYWTLDLLSFAVGGQRFDFADGKFPQLIVDSGTTFFTAEGDVYKFINSRLPSEKSCDDLEALPSLTYTLRDTTGSPHSIHVPPQEYMVEQNGNGMHSQSCMPGIFQLPSIGQRPTMILGEVFLRNYFAVFRRKDADQGSRVGLARARFDEAAEAVFAEVA